MNNCGLWETKIKTIDGHLTITRLNIAKNVRRMLFFYPTLNVPRMPPEKKIFIDFVYDNALDNKNNATVVVRSQNVQKHAFSLINRVTDVLQKFQELH